MAKYNWRKRKEKLKDRGWTKYGATQNFIPFGKVDISPIFDKPFTSQDMLDLYDKIKNQKPPVMLIHPDAYKGFFEAMLNGKI